MDLKVELRKPIPDWATHLAMDPSGALFAYDKAPVATDTFMSHPNGVWMNNSDYHTAVFVGYVEASQPINWKEVCVGIEETPSPPSEPEA